MVRPTPPKFWGQTGHPAGRLLSPFGDAYGWIVQQRLRTAKRALAGVPVICTGNVTLGGVGKTPWTMMLADTLTEGGASPHILTRGYGGSARGPLRVGGQAASEVGDEALLLARHAPVWVGADRAKSAEAARSAGADVLLMDDGYQSPGLGKDHSFLLIDATSVFGNGRVFPAGPLRERPVAAARRADTIVSVGTEGHEPPATVVALAQEKPVLTAWMALDTTDLPRDRPLHAVAGIGRPERFFDALTGAGFEVSARAAFADHHPFTAAETEALVRQAEAVGARLVTTQKDHVRLAPAFRSQFLAVPANMRTDAAELGAILAKVQA